MNTFLLMLIPTARPMNINVDYRDALYQFRRKHKKGADQRDNASRSYPVWSGRIMTPAGSFVGGSLTTANGWAAYTSRVTAVDTLVDGGIKEEKLLFYGRCRCGDPTGTAGSGAADVSSDHRGRETSGLL